MEQNERQIRNWLIVTVLLHLIVTIAHGSAHSGADIPLSRAGRLFVFTVIFAGPLVGLALTWPALRVGSWVIAIAMAGALTFGFINHFVVASPDHVAHVVARWRALFATTAVLLGATEALGAGLALRLARQRTSVS